MALAPQTMMVGSSSRFGDGKPIVLLPRFLGSDLALISLSIWLKALGYRPVTAGPPLNLEGSSGDHSLARAIQNIAQRVGRKAVLITHAFGVTQALRIADLHREWISDVVIIGALYRFETASVRTHFLSPWSAVHALTELPRVLRNIDMELIQTPDLGRVESTFENPGGSENGNG
jgi:pimeloyl-ACP methyl ester carboxylesterase